MKKTIFIVIVVFVTALFASSCGLVFDVLTEPTASLRIVNSTPYDIDYVSWADRWGDLTYFGDDMVWDEVQSQTVAGIASGSSAREMVIKGDSPIYFYFTTDDIKFRTAEDVNVDSFEDAVFVLDGDVDINLVLSGATPEGRTVEYKLIPVEGSKTTEEI